MRRKLQFLALLPLLVSGCVTHKLWTESKLDEWNEPAGAPRLRLFRDERRNDFLVVYDEYSDRHCTTRTRAFFLFQNLEPLAQHGRPYFVTTNWTCRLPPVPVLALAPTNVPAPFYAVTTNGGNFTLFSSGHDLGSYVLPLYDDGVGRMQRIAWTPLAVTADLTIIGGVVVIVVWNALAGSEVSLSARSGEFL